MPLYEYECDRHGSFTLTRPMSRASEAGPCPICDAPSARVITAPHVFSTDPARRDAIARNEKSRHEPHVCTSGCGHRHAAAARRGRGRSAGHPAGRAALGAVAGAARRAGAEVVVGPLQSYTGPRPWVVEHR